MNWIEFASNAISSLAWPGMVLVAVLLLRGPLVELIPLLSKFKVRDFEVEFSQRLEQAKSVAASSIPEELQVSESKVEQLEQSSKTPAFPRSAILEGWIALNDAGVRAVRTKSPEATMAALRQPKQLSSSLVDLGLLDKQQARLFNELRNLRNAAAHAVNLPLTDIEAIEYVSAAASLTALLESKR